MNASELRAKSADELKQELLALLREQFNLRMQRATGQVVVEIKEIGLRPAGSQPDTLWLVRTAQATARELTALASGRFLPPASGCSVVRPSSHRSVRQVVPSS